MSGSGRLRLHLGPAAQRAVRRGHPWVFADRIQKQNREGSAGEIAALYDPGNRFVGLGLYDPESVLRIRVLHVGEPVPMDAAWWAARLDTALSRREALFDGTTTGWRGIHGENDGWPGLVLDRYADVTVLKIYTGAWLPRLDELIPIFQARLPSRSWVLRLSRNIAEFAARTYQRHDGTVILGEPLNGSVEFLENGLRFEAEVIQGQKTGFYLDQRDNRLAVGRMSRGCDILNAFSFSGGFSVHAAAGGARSVIDLDISAHALASARRNMALNRNHPGVAAARHDTVQAEVFEWLAGSDAREFDGVIVDPPSLARRAADVEGALTAYARLARLAACRVRPGGWLLAGSCSAHVASEDFFLAVRDGLKRAGRKATELARTFHPADHPATFAEAHYLKGLYLRLE